MKDEKGLFYYPDPNTRDVRMYVRMGDCGVEFRLWHKDRAEVWEKHEWIPMDVIKTAAAKYKEMGRETDPMAMYDEAVAKMLIKENAN